MYNYKCLEVVFFLEHCMWYNFYISILPVLNFLFFLSLIFSQTQTEFNEFLEVGRKEKAMKSLPLKNVNLLILSNLLLMSP